MTNQKKTSRREDTIPSKLLGPRWLQLGLVWLFAAFLLFMYALHVLQEYDAGHGWLAILGIDRGLFQALGDETLPLAISLLLVWTAKGLAAGRKRTILMWIGWLSFFFLLAWWPWLRSIVAGQPLV